MSMKSLVVLYFNSWNEKYKLVHSSMGPKEHDSESTRATSTTSWPRFASNVYLSDNFWSCFQERKGNSESLDIPQVVMQIYQPQGLPGWTKITFQTHIDWQVHTFLFVIKRPLSPLAVFTLMSYQMTEIRQGLLLLCHDVDSKSICAPALDWSKWRSLSVQSSLPNIYHVLISLHRGSEFRGMCF